MNKLLFSILNLPKKQGGVYARYQSDKNSKTLTIVFSAIPQVLMLKKLDGNILRLYENTVSQKWITGKETCNTASGGWFFGDIDETLRYLRTQIIIGSWRKIVCIGSSKSGYAALLYAHFLSIAFPKATVSVLAFSPVTKLQSRRTFEQDTGVTLAKMEESPYTKEIIERYGDLAILLKNSQIHKAHIVYSDGFAPDEDDYKRIAKFSFISSHVISKKKMTEQNLHPHLTLEYIWKNDKPYFVKTLQNVLM